MKELTIRTFVAFNLVRALDTGNHSLDIEAVKLHVEKGDIFDYLKEKLKGDIDFSVLKEEDKKELLEEWRDFALSVEDSKVGVANEGICLLLGYCLEGIQRKF